MENEHWQFYLLKLKMPEEKKNILIVDVISNLHESQWHVKTNAGYLQKLSTWANFEKRKRRGQLLDLLVSYNVKLENME